MGRTNILKKSTILVFLTFGSRIFGMLREIVKAAFLGTTAFSDAFTIAFMIPNLLRRLFAEGSIAVAFVPTFKGYVIENDSQKIKEFLSAFLTFISFTVTITVVIGVLIAPQLVGLTKAPQEETTILTRIMFPYLAFISLAAFFQGILNSSNIFAPSGFTPILFNISVIAFTIFLSPYTENPARAMAYGATFGGVLQALFQLPFVLRMGYRFSFISLKKAFINPGTKKILKLVGPAILGMASNPINILISTIIASQAGTGIVSSLQFSIRLQELLLGIFAVSIGTVILTELSDNAKRKAWDKFKNNLTFAMNITALVMIPAIFFSLINAEEIISLIFKIKKFDSQSVALTAYAFIFHIMGLYFIAANRVIAPAFYAQEDTKIPSIAGIASVVVNLILCLVLVIPMKGGGIALASSIAAFFNMIILFIALSKKMDKLFINAIKNIIVYGIKISIITFTLAIPCYIFKDIYYKLFTFSSYKLITIGLPLFLMAGLYYGIILLILLVIKDPLISEMYIMVKRKLK